MAILAQSGRIVIAEAIILRPLHLAWGSGDGAWIDPPAEDADAVSLMNEVGRRVVTQAQYVVSDENGEISLPSGNFSLSAIPTKHLFFNTVFDYADASSVVIREIAIFVGTQTDSQLPSGQQYFAPSEVTDPGRLLHLENIQPVFRSPAIRETFKVVITF